MPLGLEYRALDNKKTLIHTAIRAKGFKGL
jgi:hypothetical protein